MCSCKIAWNWSWKLFVIIFSFNFANSLRLAPPDEIISILESGDYNKHHLPSYEVGNTSMRTIRTIRGANEWALILEHSHKGDYERIRLIQKEAPTGRTIRVEMNKPVAKQLVYQLFRFINHYVLDGIHEHTSKKENLLSAEIRVDPLRTYFVSYLRKSNGNEALLITEAKGRSRRSTILVPVNYWQNFTDVLEEFLQIKYYIAQGPPTNVTISMYIEGMSSFRAQTMDFHVDIYFSETWADPRLQHTSKFPVLLRDMGIFEKMWHPDLYFANAKEARYHTVTSHNFLVFIYPNGTIYLDIRISLVLNCMMDLSHYPLDQQKCFIRIMSYAYDQDNLNILWKSFDAITKNEEIKLPDMDLVKYEAEYCDGTYAIGIWACARASFKMKREIMHHVLQSYIPTALIVVISWFSFWLDVDAVPGRVSLCITTLLTLATQAQAAKMSLPQVSYAKAIDVWMGTCMGFVFGVMIEFTVVNYISRRSSSKAVAADTTGNKKRSSRLLSNASAATTPQTTRLTEFNNLLFDATVIGPKDPRCHKAHDCDSAIGLTCQHHRKESNGCVARQSLVPRESCGSCCVDRRFSQMQQEMPVQQQQTQRNRKLATTVDRFCRLVFPCSFIAFNLLYWPYYLVPRSEYS